MPPAATEGLAELKEPSLAKDIIPPSPVLKATPAPLPENEARISMDVEESEDRPSVYTVDVVSRSALPPKVCQT